MLDQLKSLLRGNYYSLNSVKLIEENIKSNYSYLSAINKTIKIAPVLKSNAYGHGITHIAEMLDDLGTPFFCVDSLHEAYDLLKKGIKTQILIMGYINPSNLSVKKLPFAYAVYDRELLKAINQYQPGAKVHIFVDTGMHREGISLEELPEFLEHLKKMPGIKVDGLMSHLAKADDTKSNRTQKQFENFDKAAMILKEKNFTPKYFHILASSGLLNSKKYKKLNIGNLARVGIAMYGIDPGNANSKLRPVLSLVTKIVQIKTLEKNTAIGYDFTFKSKKTMKIGILPIGYNDGVDRRLSNKGKVLIDGILCDIVGRISMNITTIDLCNIKNPQVGQEVVIFSNSNTEGNSIEKTAKAIGTIPYETLIHLNQSTKREVV